MQFSQNDNFATVINIIEGAEWVIAIKFAEIKRL